jgi:hypothetical protein
LIDVERLQDEEAAEWGRLERAFARVDPPRFEEPTVTPDGWSPKDLMFHVAGWLEECARVLGDIRSGTIDPTVGDEESRPGRIERLNAELFERSQQMDPASVGRSFRASRTRALAAFAALDVITPEAWEWFDESGPRHYREHVRYLDLWLDR